MVAPPTVVGAGPMAVLLWQHVECLLYSHHFVYVHSYVTAVPEAQTPSTLKSVSLSTAPCSIAVCRQNTNSRFPPLFTNFSLTPFLNDHSKNSLTISLSVIWYLRISLSLLLSKFFVNCCCLSVSLIQKHFLEQYLIIVHQISPLLLLSCSDSYYLTVDTKMAKIVQYIKMSLLVKNAGLLREGGKEGGSEEGREGGGRWGRWGAERERDRDKHHLAYGVCVYRCSITSFKQLIHPDQSANPAPC